MKILKTLKAIVTYPFTPKQPMYPEAFVEWAGEHYIRVNGGWYHRYAPQRPENLVSTSGLYAYWIAWCQ